MKCIDEKYILNSQAIDDISQQIRLFMQEKKISSRDVTKTCLSAETILLKWLDSFPSGTMCRVCSRKWMWQNHILLEIEGNPVNPLGKVNGNNDIIDDITSSLSDYVASALAEIDLSISYRYEAGKNILDIRLPGAPVGMLGRIAVAIVSALALGTAIGSCVSADMAASISSGIVTPAFSAIMSLLKTVAVIMVFTSIVAGISNIGNMSTLKNVGGVFLKSNLVSTSIFGVVHTAILCMIFDVVKMDGFGGLELLGTVYSLFLGIIPTDIISPFAQGNTLQIVFIAVCTGIILIILKPQVENVIKLASQLNMVAMYAISCICKLVPLIIFLSFFRMVLDGSLMTIIGAWKIPVTAVIIATLGNIAIVMVAAKRCGAKLSKLLKNIFPLYVMGGTTGSSTTCMPAAEKVLCDGYGVDSGLFAFAYPLGQILNKGMSTLRFLIYVFGLAEIFSIQLGMGELVSLTIVSILLSLTVPPIPGGSMAMISIMLAQFNIPVEALAIAISMEFILDMCVISGAVTCNVSEILVLAKKVKRCKMTDEWK